MIFSMLLFFILVMMITDFPSLMKGRTVLKNMHLVVCQYLSYELGG